MTQHSLTASGVTERDALGSPVASGVWRPVWFEMKLDKNIEVVGGEVNSATKNTLYCCAKALAINITSRYCSTYCPLSQPLSLTYGAHLNLGPIITRCPQTDFGVVKVGHLALGYKIKVAEKDTLAETGTTQRRRICTYVDEEPLCVAVLPPGESVKDGGPVPVSLQVMCGQIAGWWTCTCQSPGWWTCTCQSPGNVWTDSKMVDLYLSVQVMCGQIARWWTCTCQSQVMCGQIADGGPVPVSLQVMCGQIARWWTCTCQSQVMCGQIAGMVDLYLSVSGNVGQIAGWWTCTCQSPGNVWTDGMVDLYLSVSSLQVMCGQIAGWWTCTCQSPGNVWTDSRMVDLYLSVQGDVWTDGKMVDLYLCQSPDLQVMCGQIAGWWTCTCQSPGNVWTDSKMVDLYLSVSSLQVMCGQIADGGPVPVSLQVMCGQIARWWTCTCQSPGNVCGQIAGMVDLCLSVSRWQDGGPVPVSLQVMCGQIADGGPVPVSLQVMCGQIARWWTCTCQSPGNVWTDSRMVDLYLSVSSLQVMCGQIAGWWTCTCQSPGNVWTDSRMVDLYLSVSGNVWTDSKMVDLYLSVSR
ncbi:putative matrilin-4-like [Homarus americanus]|uniref:Putative matrilin-4-like n=1 Tax=Homarus americanus TaxID=6706 RepID=A0A8J5K8B1_HOMAM|nr:putative matrilin-4-like [Homarus americanus]